MITNFKRVKLDHARIYENFGNLNALNAFEDGAVVDQAALVEAGIIKSACDGVKVLSNGALTKKVTVKANAFSEAAKAKIEAAGGKAEVI